MYPRIFSRQHLRHLALAAAFASLTLSSSFAQPAVRPVPAAKPEMEAPIQFDAKDPLFDAMGKTYTAGEWEDLVKYNPPGPMFQHVTGYVILNRVPPDVLKDSIQEWVFVQAAAEEAREQGVELSDELRQRLQRDLDTVAVRVWVDKYGINEIPDVSDEEAQDYYEKNRERFKKEEELTLRHMFLSTYEEYIVEEGDSLASIAEKVSGDASKAEMILAFETKKARTEAPEGAEEAGAKALEPGEKLLVPMNDEKAGEIGAQAAKISERLKGGEDFMKVAEEVSGESGRQNLMVVRPKKDNKPVLPEVREAFESLENNGISEPIRTKHGYQIIMRLNYQPEEYVALDTVKDRIKGQLGQEKRQEKLDAILTKLWNEDSELRLNEEVLENVFKPEFADQVLFQMADVKYSGSQFTRDFGTSLSEDSGLDERREMLVRLPMVQRYLIQKDVETEKIRETESYKERASLTENDHYAGIYLNEAIAKQAGEPTDEELQAKFEEMREALERQPSADAWQITVEPQIESAPGTPPYELRMGEEEATLRAKLEGVETREQFEAKAKQLDEGPRRATGGKVGRIRRNHENGLGAQALQSPGEGLKGPFTKDGKLYMLWIENRSDTTTMELEEVKDNVTQQVKNDKMRAAHQVNRQRLLEKSGLKMHFNEKH